MPQVRDATDLLEDALAGSLAGIEPQHFVDSVPHHARLLRALVREPATGRLASSDFAVLLRAAIRENKVVSCRDGILVPQRRLSGLDAEATARHGLQLGRSSDSRIRVRAIPWHPDWLADTGIADIETELFSREPVSVDTPADPDPVLVRLGHSQYTSAAQREAVRTVLSAKPGATTVVVLPTGAGKTVCGLLPSIIPLEFGKVIEGDRFGVTPFVVPTVSLALDLERRVLEAGTFEHPCAYRPGGETAEAIRARIWAGTQGPIFASPESIVGGLRNGLLHAAAKGFLRFFVIDEAHIVATWGDEFRPAFQQLATTCRELRERASHPVSIVLMSATLTSHALTTLKDLFDNGHGFHVVHAARLRPEPRYGWQIAPNVSIRKTWTLDAVAHLPRPVILYSTRRNDAMSWYRELQERGYRRLGLIHGASTETQREQALAAWRNDDVDLMVATSAFGLGVDKRDVRAVLHATFPESLDRYYQEVGRGGRDRRPSMALMLWTKDDEAIARGLARPKFIGIERGSERWKAMFTSHERVDHGDSTFTVPTDVSPSTRREDIDMQGEENERWNQRTLLLLQRAGAIELLSADNDEAARRFIRLRVLEEGHLSDAFWADRILPRRNELLESYARDWELIQSAVGATRCLSHALQDQYEVRDPQITVIRACGSCPHCRAHETPSSIGPIRARHSPRVDAVTFPPSERNVPPALKRIKQGFIFIEPGDEDGTKLLPLAEWFARHGVRDFVLPPRLATAWCSHFACSDTPRVFFHVERVSGVRQLSPCVAFLVVGIDPPLAQGSFHVLPVDARDMSRPDRWLSDVVASDARWSFEQFMDRYVE